MFGCFRKKDDILLVRFRNLDFKGVGIIRLEAHCNFRFQRPNGMDVWPTDNRQSKSGTSQKKGKGKARKTQQSEWTYPALERGALGSATLRRDGECLDWSFAVQEKPGIFCFHPPMN